MDKVILINKKTGITTYDLIRDIKKKINDKKVKIGHCGTLDPFASGLVIILLGKATKLSDLFLKLDKLYTGEFITKIKTDTADITGCVVLENNININLDKMSQLKNYTYMQVPPSYSAKKVNGISAYKLKRENKDFSLLPNKVSIYDFSVSKINDTNFKFIARVSKGTYIRTLIEDFAMLNNNAIATCKKLKREEIGPFKLDILNIKKENIEDEMVFKVKNGVHLQLDLDDDFVKIVNNNKLVAVYKKIAEGDYKPLLIM